MNLLRLVRIRNSLHVGFAAMCGSTLILAVALTWKAIQPREIRVIPGVEDSVLRPGDVPDDSARSFAMLYVALFDNYTPATVEDLSRQLSQMVAPSFWSRASESLDKRTRLSLEGRMSCQVLLPDPGEIVLDRTEGLTVFVPAMKRTFFADSSTVNRPVVYKLRLQPARNAWGLVVAGQEIADAAR